MTVDLHNLTLIIPTKALVGKGIVLEIVHLGVCLVWITGPVYLLNTQLSGLAWVLRWLLLLLVLSISLLRAIKIVKG